ncbi:uncharacterized protein A4U43_C09F12370 [Asparagus officinalis]|uniref:Ubiquitin-like domain-containing protein n=1 Tax=Asparagus officinalis TaxID=4686 RepID=A0A5P1E720_ASPOF|nr:BAG family molecular chaperone regulator 2-like [Asparagus officinalis]ONK58421.1 uncharacterized protein A4U43_C09F12370 [Asparagus officinalis]
MLKLRSKRLFKSSSKRNGGKVNAAHSEEGANGDIEWEMRPGGMLVQKREGGRGESKGLIIVRVSTGSCWHDISIAPTSTFGDLKIVVSMATGLEPREQRLLFKGKEREDGDHLHMVGVREGDKVVLLEDPAIKERKLLAMIANQAIIEV